MADSPRLPTKFDTTIPSTTVYMDVNTISTTDGSVKASMVLARTGFS